MTLSARRERGQTIPHIAFSEAELAAQKRARAIYDYQVRSGVESWVDAAKTIDYLSFFKWLRNSRRLS